MKKQDSWSSQYRKNKFYENRNKVKDVKITTPFFKENTNPQSIAILLDLEGTTDNINSESKELFLKQLEYLRKKFNAEYVTISVSTHYNNSIKIRKLLTVLANNLPSNIKIGLSFYYGGIYDYNSNKDIPREYGFNQSKINTFKEYYLDNIFAYNIPWFAIIDDGMYDEEYKIFQNKRPMLQALPSNRTASVEKNNFMRIATTTYGFDGVVEILKKYIENIKEMDLQGILENQKNMITHLSSFYLKDKVRVGDYIFLERYFKEGYADSDDYTKIADCIWYKYQEENPSKEDLIHIQNILTIISEELSKKEDHIRLEKIKNVKEKWKI